MEVDDGVGRQLARRWLEEVGGDIGKKLLMALVGKLAGILVGDWWEVSCKGVL